MNESRAAVAAATIAAVAAILATAFSAYTGFEVSQQQLTEETERSRAEFLRSERIKAYAAFLTASSEYEARLASYIDAFSTKLLVVVLPPPDEVRPLFDDISRARHEMTRLGSVVTIVGSERASDACNQMIATASGVHNMRVARLQELAESGEPPVEQRPPILYMSPQDHFNFLRGEVQHFATLRANFIGASRDDLVEAG